MRITENFVNPRQAATGSSELQQVSFYLDEREKTIEMQFSHMGPIFRLQDIGTLIGMLEALKRRAGA